MFGPIQFATGDGSFQFADGNLGPLAVEVLALADAHFQGVDLTGAVPVITDIAPSSDKLMSDHSGDELGSTSVRRVMIEFARLRP